MKRDPARRIRHLRALLVLTGLLIVAAALRAILRGQPDYQNLFAQPVSALVALCLGIAVAVGACLLPRRLLERVDSPRMRALGRRQGPSPQGHPRVGRNEPCPCGSGRKYKRCCRGADERAERESTLDQKSASLNQANEVSGGLEMANRGLHGDGPRWPAN